MGPTRPTTATARCACPKPASSLPEGGAGVEGGAPVGVPGVPGVPGLSRKR